MLKVFVDLHRQGLIYRDKRLVNWDPKFQTAISDLEVAAESEQSKGRSRGTSTTRWCDRRARRPPRPGDACTHRVATTRPETMLGDTAIAVHPEDERYSASSASKCVLPLVGRLIPIVADAYADPEKGTGAVKITPAHDFNDFEVGRRHGLRADQHPRRRGGMLLAGNDGFPRGTRARAGGDGARTASTASRPASASSP